MQDVDVSDSFCLEISVQLCAPAGEEGILGPEQLIGLLLRLQVAPEDLLLELMSGLVIGKVVLHFKKISFKLEDVLLVIADLIIQRILLVSVGCL